MLTFVRFGRFGPLVIDVQPLNILSKELVPASDARMASGPLSSFEHPSNIQA